MEHDNYNYGSPLPTYVGKQVRLGGIRFFKSIITLE